MTSRSLKSARRPSDHRIVPICRRSAVMAVIVALFATLLATSAAAPAAAAGPSTIDITGYGWGHGRGMSQYGAFGYARDRGWSTGQILDHFYGGTHARAIGQASPRPVDPDYVRVNLVAMNDRNRILVTLPPDSTFSISGATATIPSSHHAVELRRDGLKWQVWSRAQSSAGTWSHRGTGGRVVTVGRATGSSLMKLHAPNGIIEYPGSIRGFTDGSKVRTVNVTTAERYLRGVVPNEMPAGWSPAALRAQAVAARSYLLAGDTRHTDGMASGGGAAALYADTCDTTMCQVYRGRSVDGAPSTHPSTDEAIAATAGQIRSFDGTTRIARTEFHSTSGGWTAGGTFPAVQDLGDSISPRHQWSTTKSVAPLESRCGGDFLRLDVTSRNGLGAAGGRVLQANLVCSNRTMSVTGDQIRSWLGLYSNWWSTSAANCADTAPGRYIDAVHQLFVQRPASQSDYSRWCSSVGRGSYLPITGALSVSEEWAGVQIRELYLHILERPVDGGGLQTWLAYVRNGHRMDEVATSIFASDEYFRKNGATNRSYVASLYQRILGRSADTAGLDNWTRQLNEGKKNRRAVAAGFYGSIESRTSRVQNLYRTILGRSADPHGLADWTERIRRLGDVGLAAGLAASQEYYNRVT